MAKKSKKSESLKQKFDKAYVEMRGKAQQDRQKRKACPDCGMKNCDCGCGK